MVSASRARRTRWAGGPPHDSLLRRSHLTELAAIVDATEPAEPHRELPAPNFTATTTSLADQLVSDPKYTGRQIWGMNERCMRIAGHARAFERWDGLDDR
jgi:hypothetical protein